MEFPIVLNILLTFPPRELIAAMQSIEMRPTTREYSTMVAPPSSAINARSTALSIISMLVAYPLWGRGCPAIFTRFATSYPYP